MQREYRILEFQRGNVLAQPLDQVNPHLLRIDRPSKYVENEVIVVEPLDDPSESSRRPENRKRCGVISTRIDPTYIGGTPPTLMGDIENQYEFTKCVSFEQGEEFETALEFLRAGDYIEAGQRFRSFIQKFPYHIDSYHHLGIIENELGHRGRGLKYFETGYRIGLLSVPTKFAGRLPWVRLGNRPFLRASHGYGLALEQKRRQLDAVEVYERILCWNPGDNQGIRYLLPSLYVAAYAPQKARIALEKHGTGEMNAYTLCLLEILDGRRREAVRWLCRGLSYNLHLPELALARIMEPESDRQSGVIVGGKDEAAEYLRQNDSWRSKEPRVFLQRVLAMRPIAERLQRARVINAELDSRDGVAPGKKRSDKVEELMGLFDEEATKAILEELRNAL